MRGNNMVSRCAPSVFHLVLGAILLLTATALAAETDPHSQVTVKYEFAKNGTAVTLVPPQGYHRVALDSPPYGNDSLMFFAYSPITAYDASIPLCGIAFTGAELSALAIPQDAAEMNGARDQRVFARFRPGPQPGQQIAEWMTYFRLKNQTVKLATFFVHRNDADKSWAEALHKEWRDSLTRQNQENVLPEAPMWNPSFPAQMALSVRSGDGMVLIPLPGKIRLIPPGDLWQVGNQSPVAIIQGPSYDQFDNLIRISFIEQNYRGRNPAARVKALREARTADFKRQGVSIVKDVSGREDFTFVARIDQPEGNGVDSLAGPGAGHYGFSYFFVGEQGIEIEMSTNQADTTALETTLLSWRNTVQGANR